MNSRLKIALGMVLALAGSAVAIPYGVNLVVNGDAESGAGGNGDTVLAAPGWTTTGNATVGVYGIGNGFPDTTSPGPTNRGSNFFAGGPDNDSSALTQTISLIELHGAQADFVFSAYLGGYSGQDDHVDATLSFRNSANAEIKSVLLPTVLAADRAQTSGLVFRSLSGVVPAAATSVIVNLHFVREAGSYNDGLADNVMLSLSGADACASDLNADGMVNTVDLGLFLAKFGKTVTPGSPGDFNADGVVNTVDLGIFLRHFGSPCTPS